MRLRPLEDSGICARAIYQRSSISTPQVLQGADGIALMQSRPSCPQEGSNGSHKDRHLECIIREEKRGDGKWMMLSCHWVWARPIFFLARILSRGSLWIEERHRFQYPRQIWAIRWTLVKPNFRKVWKNKLKSLYLMRIRNIKYIGVQSILLGSGRIEIWCRFC